MLHMGLAPHRGPCSQLHLQKKSVESWLAQDGAVLGALAGSLFLVPKFGRGTQRAMAPSARGLGWVLVTAGRDQSLMQRL